MSIHTGGRATRTDGDLGPFSGHDEASTACPRPTPTGAVAWVDWTRIAAIFAVVLLHSAAPLLLRYRADPARWWIGNLYDSAARWCVPVFVMLSGKLLLGREEPLGVFFRARARKVALPLLAWSVIYFVWGRLRGRRWSLWTLPALLLGQPVYYHLWFLYLILGLYLLTPIVRAYLRAATPATNHLLLGLWLIWGSLLPVVQPLVGPRLAFAPGLASTPLKLLGYFLLGFLLGDLRLQRRGLGVCLAGFGLGFALTAGGTFYLTAIRQAGVFDGLLYEYFGPGVAMMSVAAFLLLRNLRARSPAGADRPSSPALSAVGSSVLGVYLVHAMILDLVRSGLLGFRLTPTTLPPLFGVPLLAAVVTAASLALALLLRRTPWLRSLVP